MVLTAKDSVYMSLDESDFDVPAPIGKEVVEWTRRRFSKYPPPGGILELRENLRGNLKVADCHIQLTPLSNQ